MEREIKKILSTTWIPEECIKSFEDTFEIIHPRKDADDFTYEKVINIIEDFDALFVLKDFMCGRKTIETGKNLKVIASNGIGYTNVDIENATKNKVFVLNTPVGFCELTMEFSVSIIMSVIRGVAWYDKEYNNTKSEVVESMSTKNAFLFGKTLGIIGFGDIGKGVAAKALELGMKIIYYDIERSSPEEEEKLSASYVDFDDLLEHSDVVTCHIPTSEDGKYIMNFDAFQKMKDTAYFINAIRGHVVSEFDLLEALRKKEIRAAAIDIYEFQSKISDDIVSLENVVITPNIASVAYESRVNMFTDILSSIKTLSEGNIPHNVVNREIINLTLKVEIEDTIEENIDEGVSEEEELASYDSSINEALAINDAEINEAGSLTEKISFNLNLNKASKINVITEAEQANSDSIATDNIEQREAELTSDIETQHPISNDEEETTAVEEDVEQLELVAQESAESLDGENTEQETIASDMEQELANEPVTTDDITDVDNINQEADRDIAVGEPDENDKLGDNNEEEIKTENTADDSEEQTI